MFKRLHLMTVILNSIVAVVGAKFLDIHWIHLLNALILSSILYHLLEWKYDWNKPEDIEDDI